MIKVEDEGRTAAIVDDVIISDIRENVVGQIVDVRPGGWQVIELPLFSSRNVV